jgi:ribosomal protein S18 acetylase RimI-like enzyme
MDQEQRERRAQLLVDDELLNEAFDALKEDLMSRWSNSGSTDLEARESIWLAMRLLDRIRSHLISIIETGQMNKILDKQHPYI